MKRFVLSISPALAKPRNRPRHLRNSQSSNGVGSGLSQPMTFVFLHVSLLISSFSSCHYELSWGDYNERVQLRTFCLLVQLKQYVKTEEPLKDNLRCVGWSSVTTWPINQRQRGACDARRRHNTLSFPSNSLSTWLISNKQIKVFNLNS